MTHPSSRCRSIARALAVTTPLLAALWVSVGAGPARAHSELTTSTPTANARLGVAPATVKLVFSDKVEPRFTNVALTVGKTKAIALKAEVNGSTVTATIPDDERGPGAWKVSYRVVSADGHPISGTVPFTVSGSVAPTQPSPTPTPSAATPTPSTPSVTTTPGQMSSPAAPSAARVDRTLLLWVAGIIVLMVGLAYAVWRSGQSNR